MLAQTQARSRFTEIGTLHVSSAAIKNDQVQVGIDLLPYIHVSLKENKNKMDVDGASIFRNKEANDCMMA